MSRPNPNFTISLGVIITTLLNSIRPKHSKTKILHVSFLVLNFAKSETKNATQKFLNFVVEKLIMFSPTWKTNYDTCG
jgi:hypothetical protein